MKKLFVLLISLITICSLVVSPLYALAASLPFKTSSEFPTTGDEDIDSLCQVYYAYICDQVLSRYKKSDFKEAFGTGYLKKGYVYYNAEKGLFYVKIDWDITDIPSGVSNISGIEPRLYYFKLNANKKFDQIDGPEQPISESDWVLVNRYSEIDCYSAAQSYFNNQRWKDPSSIIVYGYTVAYGAGTYIYYIDYSGKNSFGGNTRDTFVIEVDAATNEVLWGASSN